MVWQSVTQRIREFGLRRAKGATIANVRAQVLVEMVIMTSLALLVGVVLLGAAAAAAAADATCSIVAGRRVRRPASPISVAAIYLLTLPCGWYPSRLATKIQPAEALHYE